MIGPIASMDPTKYLLIDNDLYLVLGNKGAYLAISKDLECPILQMKGGWCII